MYKTSDYINEDTQQQNAYNNAANGEAIISGSQNPTMDKSKLNKLLIKLTLLKMLYMVPLNFKMIKMLLIKQSLN